MKFNPPVFTALRRWLVAVVVSAMAFGAFCWGLPQWTALAAAPGVPEDLDFADFETHLEVVRQSLKIPGR